MPIQMGWLERRCQNPLNLCSEFNFYLGELGLSQKFGDAFIAVEKASLIDQRRHLFPGGERSPSIDGHIADDRQVNPEGKLRMLAEYLHGMQRPGARHHQ